MQILILGAKDAVGLDTWLRQHGYRIPAGAADVLADGTRHELANYRNVAIPSNLVVTAATRRDFAGFYAALFDRTLADNPGTVVTEYAWTAGTCDPCPDEPLSLAELATLGVDVLPSYAAALRGGDLA